jgi:predicted nicotinamide N-methyase
MLQTRPHTIHFKPILDFGEGQELVSIGAEYATMGAKDFASVRPG